VEDDLSPPNTKRCLLAAEMQALEDSGWAPTTDADREATGVVLGNGMSATADILEAGAVLVSITPLLVTTPSNAAAMLLGTRDG
jgi:3-oxoacyl-[acyl-carrier-protein] synthase II